MVLRRRGFIDSGQQKSAGPPVTEPSHSPPSHEDAAPQVPGQALEIDREVDAEGPRNLELPHGEEDFAGEGDLPLVEHVDAPNRHPALGRAHWDIDQRGPQTAG